MKDLNAAYSKQLKKISPNVTPTDKLLAQIEIPISLPTLNKYLDGKGVKADTAERVYTFLNNRIMDRAKNLVGSEA